MVNDQVTDVYSDNFQIVGTAYGVTFLFSRSIRESPRPGEPPKFEPVATIRMSWEHAKALAFIMCRHIKAVEKDMGVSHELPIKDLNAMRISPEDWQNFWKSAP